jgi:cob(I)alamin adenosyltransferase
MKIYTRKGDAGETSVWAYLNRLSDLLFVAARAANSAAGVPDMTWTSASRRQPSAPVTRKPEADANGR